MTRRTCAPKTDVLGSFPTSPDGQRQSRGAGGRCHVHRIFKVPCHTDRKPREMAGVVLAVAACSLLNPSRAAFRPRSAHTGPSLFSMSLLDPLLDDAAEQPPSPEDLRRRERLKLVAERYDLDPEVDGMRLASLASSSLPEEENGTWLDVAACSLRNACFVGLLLAAVGALPGQASAAMADNGSPSDAEQLDVIASIFVPLVLGGGLVAFLAGQYPKLIDKIQGGGR